MPPLLLLPLEIRLQILSYLLVFPSKIWLRRYKGGYRNYNLFPRVLEVNHQLCTEGRSLLYGMNTFEVRIQPSGFRGIDTSSADSIFGDLFKPASYHDATLELVQRCDAHVAPSSADDFGEVQAIVKKFVLELPWWMPHLQYLSVRYASDEYDALGLNESLHHTQGYRVLEPFTRLREVPMVEFTDGVPKSYARYLQALINGRSCYLHEMYHALVQYGEKYPEYEEQLHRACIAMQEGSVADFKMIREEFVQMVANALNDLQGYDRSGASGYRCVVMGGEEHHRKRRRISPEIEF